MEKKKVLVIATEGWPLPARISIALSKVGFQVAAVSPRGGVTRWTKAILAHFAYRPWAGAKSIERAINAWDPDLLVCSDDRAIKYLHDLHCRTSSADDKTDSTLANLIETSLGDPSSFPLARQKSKFILFAQSIGVRCPRTIVNSSSDDDSCIEQFPIVVKADGTYGGMGVRFAANAHEARRAIVDLMTSMRWPGSDGPPYAKNTFMKLFAPMRPHRQTVCLQEYIVGRPANRAVACWKGEVLAGVSVQAIETNGQFGPASVIQVIDQSEMTVTVEILVKRLNLSGFIGFDFVLDSANQAWLLEMNPRVTPPCHLTFADGINLSAALYSKITGAKLISSASEVVKEKIVLFPTELMRTRHSPYLARLDHSTYHDVPWEEPELVRACIGYALESGIPKQFRRRLRPWL